MCDQDPRAAEEADSENHQQIFQCQHVLSPFFPSSGDPARSKARPRSGVSPETLRELPLCLKGARNHPRAVRHCQAHWAAVRSGWLHEPQREVKKRGLHGQRGKQRQQRDDDHSSESKHRFHVCSPEVRWAVQLFAVANGS
jgi:hypothetical protein